MKWLIVTCDASAHIRPVQEWLFKKYAPDAELYYLNLGFNKSRVDKWGEDVGKFMPSDRFCFFGLDDYLPTSSMNPDKLDEAIRIMETYNLDRFELGYGASNKAGFIDHGSWLAYGTATPYSVSCQFSIWKLSRLREILSQATNPWNFETKHHCWAGCFPKGQEAFRWIEESALSSKKWPGKINVNGLPADDVAELIRLGLLDEGKLINRA